MFQFCLIRNYKSENTTHCALSLMIWNKLRAFQNEGRVWHGKNVTGRMVNVEGAVGCLVVLEEQCVMCSLVSLLHKGSVREPWILRLEWWAGSLDVLLGNKSMIACSGGGQVQIHIILRLPFSVMEILSSFSQLRCMAMTLLVMNLQRYKVRPLRLLGLVTSIICLGKNYYYIQEKSGVFSNHPNRLINNWRLSWYFLHHSLEKRSRSVWWENC